MPDELVKVYAQARVAVRAWAAGEWSRALSELAQLYHLVLLAEPVMGDARE
jgi:hypothetical protein